MILTNLQCCIYMYISLYFFYDKQILIAFFLPIKYLSVCLSVTPHPHPPGMVLMVIAQGVRATSFYGHYQ